MEGGADCYWLCVRRRHAGMGRCPGRASIREDWGAVNWPLTNYQRRMVIKRQSDILGCLNSSKVAAVVLPNGIGAPFAEMDLNGADIQRRAVLRSCVWEASLPPLGPFRGWGIKQPILSQVER